MVFAGVNATMRVNRDSPAARRAVWNLPLSVTDLVLRYWPSRRASFGGAFGTDLSSEAVASRTSRGQVVLRSELKAPQDSKNLSVV